MRGTVVVGELMRVERYSHVMHMVKSRDVTGFLEEEKRYVDPFLRATFTAGTMTGAPKIKSYGDYCKSRSGSREVFIAAPSVISDLTVIWILRLPSEPHSFKKRKSFFKPEPVLLPIAFRNWS